eukprot:jgi/Hompol1/362/HPOL_005292-RA
MLLLYHSLRIELHLPRIVRLAGLGLYSMIIDDAGFAMCVQAVIAVDSIFKIFLQHNPYFFGAPSGSHLCITPVAITLWIIGLVRYPSIDMWMLEGLFERLVKTAENCTQYWDIVQVRVDIVRRLRRKRTPLGYSQQNQGLLNMGLLPTEAEMHGNAANGHTSVMQEPASIMFESIGESLRKRGFDETVLCDGISISLQAAMGVTMS